MSKDAVWDYFTKIDSAAVASKAQCKECCRFCRPTITSRFVFNHCNVVSLPMPV